MSWTWNNASPSTGTLMTWPAVCLPLSSSQLPHWALFFWNPISPQPTRQTPQIAFKSNLFSSSFPSFPCFPHGPCQCSSAHIDCLVSHTSSYCITFSLFAQLPEEFLHPSVCRVQQSICRHNWSLGNIWLKFRLSWNLAHLGKHLSVSFPLNILFAFWSERVQPWKDKRIRLSINLV